jgi:hypothetical protein
MMSDYDTAGGSDAPIALREVDLFAAKVTLCFGEEYIRCYTCNSTMINCKRS